MLLFTGCESKKATGTYAELIIAPEKINSWVNLMPGKSPTFHISGTVKLINNSGIRISDVSIEKISVIKDDTALFVFKPEIKWLNSTKNFQTGDTVKFYFKNSNGLSISKEPEYDKMLNILFSFSYNGKIAGCIVKNIKIEKVY